MKTTVLFDDGTRRWLFLGRDPQRPDRVIDTNEYVVLHAGKALLLDPGGTEVFPAIAAAVAREVRLSNIEALFGSHQDPDIISSLPLWLSVMGDASVYVPAIWESFLRHFSLNANLVTMPDEGCVIPLNGTRELRSIPSHYVHASASFGLYDPRARILFSGDVGAALLPDSDANVFVENFDEHVRYMEGFHRRWMPSNRAKNAWVRRVRELDVDMMCPQHGAVFRGEDVARFLDWFEALEVGSAVRAEPVTAGASPAA